MALISRHPWIAASILLVPVLTLAAPGWPRLAGVGPCWAILWLLPWALSEGRRFGVLAGAILGLLLDSLHQGGASEMPALMLLGWWWGRIGRLGPPVERSFSLGLLALLGTLGLDLTLMLQWALRSGLGGASRVSNGGIDPAPLAQPGWHLDDLAGAGLHGLLARTLLTALLAPVLCSLQLLLWRQLGGRLGRR
jgi:rod shape-determining protein MreD